MRVSAQSDRHRSTIRLVLLLAGLPCALYGYIDPGSGSFLIQSLLAGLLGLSFTFKSFWRSLKKRFDRNADSEPKQS